MKGDDDTFVRVDAVIEAATARKDGRSLYIGNMNYFHEPLRSGKWTVTYEVIRQSWFIPSSSWSFFTPCCWLYSDSVKIVASDPKKLCSGRLWYFTYIFQTNRIFWKILYRDENRLLKVCRTDKRNLWSSLLERSRPCASQWNAMKLFTFGK